MKYYLGLFLIAFNAMSDTFSASVDKTMIEEGESFMLKLTYYGHIDEEPDLSVLANDFIIESRETAKEVQTINHHTINKTIFTLYLSIKSSHAQLTIPPITLGKLITKPIIIEQKPATNINKDLYIVSEVDINSAYIHQEIILTITVTTSLSLYNASLNIPDIKDAVVEELVSDEPKSINKDGVMYQILTKKYSIFPTKANNLHIPAIKFSGMAKENPSSRWPSFFNHGKRINAQAKPININIKDVPPSYPQDQPFWPLKNLVIIETDEANASFIVGKPVIRKFELKAKGTLTSLFPEIKHPDIDGLSIYPELGKKIQQNVHDGIEAKLDFSFTYIPNQAKAVLVPQMLIYWWDVSSDKLKLANIREMTMEVLANGQVPIMPALNAAEPKKEHSYYQILLYIIYAIIVIIIIGIISLIVFKLLNKKSIAKEFKYLRAQVIDDCHSNNIRNVYINIEKMYIWSLKLEHAELAIKFNTMMLLLDRSLYHSYLQNMDHNLLMNIKDELLAINLPKYNEKILKPLYPL